MFNELKNMLTTKQATGHCEPTVLLQTYEYEVTAIDVGSLTAIYPEGNNYLVVATQVTLLDPRELEPITTPDPRLTYDIVGPIMENMFKHHQLTLDNWCINHQKFSHHDQLVYRTHTSEPESHSQILFSCIIQDSPDQVDGQLSFDSLRFQED